MKKYLLASIGALAFGIGAYYAYEGVQNHCSPNEAPMVTFTTLDVTVKHPTIMKKRQDMFLLMTLCGQSITTPFIVKGFVRHSLIFLKRWYWQRTAVKCNPTINLK